MTKNNIEVPLLDLVSSLSYAVDLINPILHNHHKQVAYIAYKIGKEFKLPSERQNNLVMASLLHDIGGLNTKARIDVLSFENQNPHEHAEIGYLLLKDAPQFTDIAKIIRYHHIPWQNGRGKRINNEDIPIESHILHLADRIAVSISKGKEILTQVKGISRLIEEDYATLFHPQALEIFRELKKKEYFWFDIVSPYLEKRLKEMWKDCNKKLNIEELLDVVKIFARVIDFRSRFTAIHSSGVAVVAEELAQSLGWSSEDCTKMKIAGYLHDLGKLAVGDNILEKKGKLTEDEFNIMKIHAYHSYSLLANIEGLHEINQYASLHHERLKGDGYPFHMMGEELSMGSRIMAVADVFTAITEDRPYRIGMTDENAIKILKDMSENLILDASIVDLLNSNFKRINKARVKAQTQAAEEYESFSQQIMGIRRASYA